MVRCIGGVKFSMKATVLTRLPSDGVVPNASTTGTYVPQQDPDSGDMITVFVPDATPGTSPPAQYDIECYARGYTELGFRSSANREVYLKQEYTAFEAVEFNFPAKYDKLTRQSFVTNIRDPRISKTLWIEEETGLPTVFQVQSVTPLFDMFGKLREWSTVLLRAEIQ